MILADHGKVISMEDDNVTSANYLDFINAGLKYFEDDEEVYSICGYCPLLLSPLQQSAGGDFGAMRGICRGAMVFGRKNTIVSIRLGIVISS